MTTGDQEQCPDYGPGTELAKSIKFLFWIIRKPLNLERCNCVNYECMMNVMGCDGCEENINLIMGWLKDGARAHGEPFSKMIAMKILKQAIRRARKKEREHAT